jgi:hypothetical protein
MPSKQTSNNEEFVLKRWEVIIAAVALGVTAVVTLLTYNQAQQLHDQEAKQAQTFHDQEAKQAQTFHQDEKQIAEQQLDLATKQFSVEVAKPANQVAQLAAFPSMICDLETMYVPETISVTNAGYKSAQNVRISITDPSEEIRNAVGWCTSPYTPLTPIVTLAKDIRDRRTTIIELPTRDQFDPGQSCILQFQFQRDGNWDKGKFDERSGAQQINIVYSALGESRTVTPTRNSLDIQGIPPTLICGYIPRPAPGFLALGTHTVKQGEGLQCIGRGYKVDPYAIAAENAIPSPYAVYPGQVLIIPPVPWYNIPAGDVCALQFPPPFGWPP